MAPASPMSASVTRSWLAGPLAYTVLTPLLIVLGSATTIIAPILLEPSAFAGLVMLSSVFMYAADFDLGLSRLADRMAQQHDSAFDVVLLARLVVAGAALGLIGVVSLWAGWLFGLAATAGILFMLSNGPVSYYRARGQQADFTRTALLVQFGLSLPRLAGLLVAGVPGLVAALSGWYLLTAVRNTAPLWRRMLEARTLPIAPVMRQSLPLFVFNYLWMFFLLANRLVAWALLDDAHALGLFSFGANLLYIGVGIIGNVAQAYYPKHLQRADPRRLRRETIALLAVLLLGVGISEILCAHGLALLFPHFRDALPATAMMLVSGVPLCLCAWLIPLVIARSDAPYRQAAVLFGSTLAALTVSMSVAASHGLIALSASCLVPTLLLLAQLCRLIVRANLLTKQGALWLWCGTLGGVLLCMGLWSQLFL